MSVSLAPQEKKLTQRQRSEISKDKLVAATVECLIESGYSATSTQEVCTRAGLSKGGLFRQFSSRTELMIATVQSIYKGLLMTFEQEFTQASKSIDPIQAGVELVRSCFSRREFQAAMELQMAARTDESLARCMRSVIEDNNEAVLRLACRLFPEAAEKNPRFSVVVNSVVFMIQGEVFAGSIFDEPIMAEARLKFIEDIVRREFTPNTPVVRSR